MNRAARFWLIIFVIMAVLTTAGYFIAPVFGDGSRSEGMSFEKGGAFGLGYDVIGRPIFPQLLSGGILLLFTSVITAIFTILLGSSFGMMMAAAKNEMKLLRFFLDVILVMPMMILMLAFFQAFKGSLYSIIPIAAILSLPYYSRYYEKTTKPLMKTGFYEYARISGKSSLNALVQEIVPILKKNILTDLGSTFIGSCYMISAVSFLGASTGSEGFIWSVMVAENISGLALNPWASFAPIIAIIFLTAPVNFFIDSLERKND